MHASIDPNVPVALAWLHLHEHSSSASGALSKVGMEGVCGGIFSTEGIY